MDPTTSLDLKQIVDHVYGADGSPRVLISLQLDTAYSVTLNRRESLRFRINIFPVQTMRGPGMNLVFRPIPTLPPSLDEQRVEQEIRDTNLLRSGMVLTGGSTGSGKTTLQFGLIHERLMDPTVSCNISTGEQPIEFLFDSLKPPNGNRITQTEIRPPNLTPPLFVEGSMRRENSDLVLGECRDGPTMEAAINCAITGGKLSTTIHADNGPLMIQRSIALCPRAERDNLVSALAQSLRFVINQRLLERVGGGRVAVREFLTFHQDLRRQLMRTESELWPDLVAQAIGIHHDYPDGLMLFLGTMFAPTQDRHGPGQGFTHTVGDIVRIAAPELGALVNRVAHADKAPRWTFGIGALMRNLGARGLLH